MLSGIGGSLWLQAQSSKFKVQSFIFLVLALASLVFPAVSFATTTIDFSSAKDFFKEIKVGDTVSGDLEKGSIPNPYEGGGQLVGYKFTLPYDVDPKNVDVKAQSCSFLFVTLCFGQSFAERMYVMDSHYKPIGDGFKHKNSLDWGKFDLPSDRTVYLLVGSDDATGTGQFLLWANLKETGK